MLDCNLKTCRHCKGPVKRGGAFDENLNQDEEHRLR